MEKTMEYSSQFMFIVIAEILFFALVITILWLIITRKRLQKQLRLQQDHAQRLKVLLQDIALCYQQMQKINEQVNPMKDTGQQDYSILNQLSKRQVDNESWLTHFDLAPSFTHDNHR